ncbi:MAG: hypothetical protein LBI18_05690 [Planctomycetaceae bacterium]|nr:hypothetical protein [Planctomycetaceae bacterium]
MIKGIPFVGLASAGNNQPFLKINITKQAQFGAVSSKVGDVVNKVGDVSPKHHVGGSRLAPAYGRQFVLSNGLESNYQPNTGSSRLAPTRPWVKTLRRKVAYLRSPTLLQGVRTLCFGIRRVGNNSPKAKGFHFNTSFGVDFI